jgi:hypothetical protein
MERVRTTVKPGAKTTPRVRNKAALKRLSVEPVIKGKGGRPRSDKPPPPPKLGKFGGTHSRSPKMRMAVAQIRAIDEAHPGLYPHQKLLEITRTGKVWSNQKNRMDSKLFVQVLIAAAPYFAPRMASVHLRNDPPFLNADLAKLQNIDPEKIAIANEVLGKLYGHDYANKPILDLQRLETGGTPQGGATGNIYGDVLAEEAGVDADDDGDGA